MTEFPYPELIPSKFVHKLIAKPDFVPDLVLMIDHEVGGVQKGVDLRLTPDDLKMSKDDMLERFIKPALAALEAAISNGR